MSATINITTGTGTATVTLSTGARGPSGTNGSDASVTQSNVTSAITDEAQFRGDIGAQSTLISGTNIKSINGNSLLGGGDLTVSSDLTSGPVTSSAGVSAIADAALSIAKTSGLQTALDSKVDDSQLTTNGGANKVLQFDSNGNLYLSPLVPSTTLTNPVGGNGNLVMRDAGMITWNATDGSGTITGAGTTWMQMNYLRDHPGGGTFQMVSSGGMAAVWSGGYQFGWSDGRSNFVFMQGMGANATYTLNKSIPVAFHTTSYTGGSSASNYLSIQGRPLDTSGTNSILEVRRNVTNLGSSLDLNGTAIAEIGSEGVWSAGTAPAFDTLTDGATITQICSKYKTAQAAKVTLGGNRTLAISGALAGMRGVIYVSQDETGSRTLALPTGSVTATDWALSTVGRRIDKLAWEYDGTYFYWQMTKGLEAAFDSDASAFFTAASITDATQKSAVNNLVVALKSNSLWTKIYAIYPFVGGSSSSHAESIKGNYDIAWSGSVTHNSNGITGDGSSGYGISPFTFSSVSAANSASIYAYCRTQTPTSDGYLIGAVSTTGGNSRMGLASEGTGVKDGGVHNDAIGTLSTSTASDRRRHLFINRSSSTAIQLCWDSTEVTATNSVTLACSQPMGILCRNFQAFGADKFSNANLAMVMFGESFTTAERTTFRAIVDTFQTTLGRRNP